MQEYDPAWSDTEESDSVQNAPQASEVSGPSLATETNAAVAQDAVPVGNSDLDEMRRQQIAALLEEALPGSQDASARAATPPQLGAFAAGFRLVDPAGAPVPISQSPCLQHFSRTLWTHGAYVSECAVTMPGTPYADPRPTAAGVTEQGCDFGIGPIERPVDFMMPPTTSSGGEHHACGPGVPIPAGGLSGPRPLVVLPPPRGSAARMDATTRMASPVQAEQGLTALPPRPPRRLPQPSATRSAPYDLPGPHSTREERAEAATALRMSRRYYERVVLGMQR